MRSTRNRENGKQRQKSKSEMNKEKEEEEEEQAELKKTKKQAYSSLFSTSPNGDMQHVSNSQLTSSEGNVAGVQLLEQQKKRIEQLEKDLNDARVEIEKLRLYNRQLALSLTSLHRHGMDSCKSCTSSLIQQSTIPCQHANSESTCGPVDSTVSFGSPLTSERVTRPIDYSNQEQNESWEATNKQEKKTQSRYWTAEEHMRFLEGLARFGHKDMKAIARFVGTRNATQVRTHAQKYYLKLAREAAKRQEQQHSHFNSAFGNGSSEDRRGCISAPGTPSYLTSVGKRNLNYDDCSFSLEGFKSARLASERSSCNEIDSDSTTRMNWFSNSTVFHAMSLDQDSSGGELSTTSEGNSESRNVSSDYIGGSHYRPGATELLLERDKSPLYVDLYQEKRERAASGNFLDVSLVEEKAQMDSQFDSFSLQHQNSSLTALGDLNDEHFAEFDNSPKLHSIREKGIGNLSSSGNSLMEFDDSHEVVRAIVESEHKTIAE